MGQRLASASTSQALRDAAFPSMMLLSLVRMLSSGLNPLPGGGAIVIGAAQRDAGLEWVADGVGMGEVIGSGVRLANIRGRLAALYGPSASLALKSNAPRGVRRRSGSDESQCSGSADSETIPGVAALRASENPVRPSLPVGFSKAANPWSWVPSPLNRCAGLRGLSWQRIRWLFAISAGFALWSAPSSFIMEGDGPGPAGTCVQLRGGGSCDTSSVSRRFSSR
jgi:hypothetical protein